MLDGDSWHVGPDSTTYLWIAGYVDGHPNVDRQDVPLIAAGENSLGPVLIASIARSLWGIALLDMTIFVVSIVIASKLPGVRPEIFFYLLIFDAITTPSLFTLNKEIIALLSVVLFARYVTLQKRTLSSLALVLIVSLLVRWEQCFVTLALILLESKPSFLRGRRRAALLAMVLCVTLCYPLVVSTGILDLSGMITYAGSGNTGPILNNIQAHYGFPIVLLPKMMISLFGHLLSPALLFSDFLSLDPKDIQSYWVLPLHCMAMFVVLIAAALKRKLKLSDMTTYWSAIYLILVAVSPVLQPRYLFPVYVLLCLKLSGFVGDSRPVQLAAHNAMIAEA